MRFNSVFKSKILTGVGVLLLSFGTLPVLQVGAVNPNLFSKRLEEVQEAVNLGTNVNMCDRHGFTPLMVAARDGNINTVRVLLRANASVDIHSYGNLTALHMAVDAGSLDVVRELIKFGANVNERANSNKTALHMAAEKGYSAIVGVLLDNGANIFACDIHGRTPIDYVDTNDNGSGHTISEMFAQMCNIIVSPSDCSRHLIDAIKFGSIDRVRCALIGDVNGYFKDRALCEAVKHYRLDIVEQLILDGANVNNFYGSEAADTPLHLAVEQGYPDMVIKLIDAGANVSVCNGSGRLPWDLAMAKGYRDIAAVLEAKSGARRFALRDRL